MKAIESRVIYWHFQLMYREIGVLVLEIKVAIHNSWSKIVSCVFFLFSSYDMFLLDFNNYPRIFFPRYGVCF